MQDFSVDKSLYTGSPENLEERAEVERRCYELLNKLGIPYFRVEHDEAETIEKCHYAEEILGAEICKNLFLCNRQKTRFYLLLLRGDKVFHTKDLSHQLGCSRLSFASGEDMERYLGMKPGSASVLGLMNDEENHVQLVIDESVNRQELWGCHPCKNTASLRIAREDILKNFLPAVQHEPIFVDLPEEEQTVQEWMTRILLVLTPGSKEKKEQAAALCDGKMQPIFLPELRDNNLHLLEAAEVVFGEPTPEQLRMAKKLQWLQISWAGADRFVPTLRELPNVRLTNGSGAYGITIAEHSIGMLLALTRRLPEYMAQQRNSIWKDAGSEWSLYGKRALILGTGNLGTQLACRLRAFGMELTGLSRSGQALSAFDRVVSTGELDRELPLADVVFGCLPGTPETAGLLHRERLLGMKKDAIIINVGRGSLIPLDDLLYALEQGQFFGVGLDVVEKEPLPTDHPLWSYERVLLTPHVAGLVKGHLESTQNFVWNIFLENLRRYLAGEPLDNQVSLSEGY